MTLNPYAAPLAAALALHAAIGTALLNGVSFIERSQDDLYLICFAAMWVCAAAVPLAVAIR